MTDLVALEAAFLEREREAAEREMRGAGDRVWFAKQIERIRRIMAVADVQPGGSDEGQVKPAGGLDVSDAGEPRAERIARLREEYGPHLPFLVPEKDDNGKSVYDDSVPRGLKTNRERAWALARVYGERLRESSLADVIFRTGETRATSPQSVRGGLSGLVRYGQGWVRDRGELVYQGNDLRPDGETINRLIQERDEAHALADQTANTTQFES